MSRIAGWDRPGPPRESVFGSGEGDGGQAPGVARPDFTIDGGLLDTAFEQVIKDFRLSGEQADRVKTLLTTDASSDFFRRFHDTNRAVAAHNRDFHRTARAEIVLPSQMSADAVAALTEYAPEYNLRFTGEQLHDHAAANACRKIDRALVYDRLPPTAVVVDIGGDPVWHAGRGHLHVHSCSPDVDRKDAVRAVQRKLVMQRLAAEAEFGSASANYAKGWLGWDPELVCDKRVQDCDHKATVVTSMHVYDIPLTDWPAIMEKKGAKVIEAAFLFSDRFFDTRVGVLKTADARYHIDPVKDTISMGFVGSNAWWYEHKWSQFAAFGVDQMLYGPDCAYSYKIVERRGDTYFARMLRVPLQHAGAVPKVTLRLPEVPVVRVHGFDINTTMSVHGSKALVRVVREYPRNLWQDLVRQAQLDFERGAMTFERMYNHYRTISPRQTINARLVMGGEPVTQQHVVPLIVHACVAAAQLVIRGQMETMFITRQVASERDIADRIGIVSALEAVIGSVSKVFKHGWLAKACSAVLSSTTSAITSNMLLTWGMQVEHVTLPFDYGSRVVTVRSVDGGHGQHHRWLLASARATAEGDLARAVVADPKLAASLLRTGWVLDTTLMAKCEALVAEATAGVVPAAGPGYAETVVSSTARVSDTLSGFGTGPPVGNERRIAISEAVVDNSMEHKAVESTAQRRFAVVCPRGVPNAQALRNYADEYGQPDIWLVEAGVLVSSARGVSPQKFQHSAVYVPPVVGKLGGMSPVVEIEWTGKECGVQIERAHYAIADALYSGPVYVDDTTMVYNGPAIVDAFNSADTVPHDYSLVVQRGPPGCGKSYAIRQRVKELVARDGDMGDIVVLSPTRASAGSLLKALRGELSVAVPRQRVRTLDSYLVNWRVTRPEGQRVRASTVFVDEVYMARAGKWYAAFALLGAKRVFACGDPKQIEVVSRAQAPVGFLSVVPDSYEDVYVSYRCPVDVIAGLSAVYGNKIRTVSSVLASMRFVLGARAQGSLPSGTLLTCMYQDEKKQLEKLYAAEVTASRLGTGPKVVVNTVHEVQGGDFEHVRLHRFDTRVREGSDKGLYDKERYALVAVSRHKQTFQYICPVRMQDQVMRFMDRADDKRLLSCAQDVASAGVSREF